MSHQSASCNGSNLEVVWLALPVVSLSITFIFFQWIYCQKYSLHLSCKAWKKSNQYLQALHKVSKISRVELNISSPLRMPNRNTCTYIKLDLCKTTSTHQIPPLGLLFLAWILQRFLTLVNYNEFYSHKMYLKHAIAEEGAEFDITPEGCRLEPYYEFTAVFLPRTDHFIYLLFIQLIFATIKS